MLELQNLSFQVSDNTKGQKEIIKDINLTFDDHAFIAITGPNGGGKSTLAKLIMGIEQPTSGRILFNGTDITGLNITDRARLGISFAFQQPVRFKGIKVKDLIALAAQKQPGPTQNQAGPASGQDTGAQAAFATNAAFQTSQARTNLSSACDYLSQVGLCARDYINRDVDSSLSGGELKRIEIATIIARNAPLAVFDEPEAGIDLWSFSNLIKVFEDLHQTRDNSLIIISHQERILNIADEIVAGGGQCAGQGTQGGYPAGAVKGYRGVPVLQVNNPSADSGAWNLMRPGRH